MTDPPPWLADLPRHPGYENFPILASQIHPSGDGAGPDQLRALGWRFKCAGCGCDVHDTGWTILLDEGGPAAACTRFPGPLITSSAAAPFHLSCLIYSALGCPALKSAKRIYREHPLVKGKPRGKARLIEFRHMGFPAWRHENIFALWDLGRSIKFNNSAELAKLLPEAIRGENVEVETRLYWRENDPTFFELIESDRAQYVRDAWLRLRDVKVGEHIYKILVIR